MRAHGSSALFVLQFMEQELVVHTYSLAEIVEEFNDGERLISGPVVGDQEVEPMRGSGR